MSYQEWVELDPDIQADIITTTMVMNPMITWSPLLVDHIDDFLPTFNALVGYAQHCEQAGINNGADLIRDAFDNVLTLVSLVVPDLAEFSKSSKKGSE